MTGRCKNSILWFSFMDGNLRRKFSNHSFAEVEKMGGNEGQFRNRKRTTEGGQSNYKATGDLRGTENIFYIIWSFDIGCRPRSSSASVVSSQRRKFVMA